MEATLTPQARAGTLMEVISKLQDSADALNWLLESSEDGDGEAKYLLSREEASERYGISLRQLDGMLRRNRDFPALNIGKRVMIHRERADKWFTEALRTTIEVD